MNIDPNEAINFMIKNAEAYAKAKANVVYFGKLHPFWLANLQNTDVVRTAAMFMLGGHAVTTEDNDQPIMSVVFLSDQSNARFFGTIAKMASQVATMQACEAAS